MNSVTKPQERRESFIDPVDALNAPEMKELAQLAVTKFRERSRHYETNCLMPEENLKELFQRRGHARDRGGRDKAGDGKLDSTGMFAPASGSGKASAAVDVDFEQQLFRTQGREDTARKVMEQVVSGARMQVENGRTRAKIFLEPPALGKVTLHIVTKDDQVRVAFYAETPQVKEIIESNLSQLRQSFTDQGMRTDSVEVFVGYQQAGNQAWQSPAFDVPEVPASPWQGRGRMMIRFRGMSSTGFPAIT